MELFSTQREIAKDWWQGLAKREQRILLWGSVALFILLYYFLFYTPIQASIDKMISSLDQNQSLYQWMQTASTEIKQTQTTSIEASKNLPLLSLIENTLKSSNLAQSVDEMKSLKENQVQITLKNVNYEKAMHWLDLISKTYSLIINKVTISATDVVGVVQIDTVLQR